MSASTMDMGCPFLIYAGARRNLTIRLSMPLFFLCSSKLRYILFQSSIFRLSRGMRLSTPEPASESPASLSMVCTRVEMSTDTRTLLSGSSDTVALTLKSRPSIRRGITNPLSRNSWFGLIGNSGSSIRVSVGMSSRFQVFAKLCHVVGADAEYVQRLQAALCWADDCRAWRSFASGTCPCPRRRTPRPKSWIIREPSLLPMFSSPMLETRQEFQPSMNFREPISVINRRVWSH